MKKAIQEPSLHFLGLSSDLRTNRWRIHCACGNHVDPNTTMYANQSVSCRCGREYACQYNDRTIKEIVQ